VGLWQRGDKDRWRWIVDAHREGRRYFVHSDELLSAFLVGTDPTVIGRVAESRRKKCTAYGEIYTVRYEAVSAMLLNEFVKEHRKVEEQGAMIAKQQKQIEALTATVQKVSDQVALSKPAPQLVANP